MPPRFDPPNGAGLLAGQPETPSARVAAQLQHAVALHSAGRIQDARLVYQAVLEVEPNHFDALQLSALAEKQQGNHQTALELFGRALRIDQSQPAVFNNLGVTLQELGHHQQALACFADALRLKPDYAEALNNRGLGLAALNRHVDAVQSFDDALQVNPSYPAALNNRGNSLHALGRSRDAIGSFRQALLIKPEYAECHNNLGYVLRRLGRHEDALAAYQEAVRLRPDYADAHWNYAILLLLLGRYPQGWLHYEWRLVKQDMQHNFMADPLHDWRGQQDVAGKRVLVYAEQGLGDTLQFVRYLPLIATLGAQVILEANRRLLPLLASMGMPLTLVAKGDPLPSYDFSCPLMSLPMVFGTTLQTIPAAVPYLFADPQKVAIWQQRLGLRRRLRVGIAWSGSATHRDDAQRSLGLAQLVPLLALPVEWHSLQKEYRDADLAVLQGLPHLRQHHDSQQDFSDAAALVECMDLIVSVDTSVVHLAGALGKPVWVLLSRAVDFRWLLDREDSPWYPSARLFRLGEDEDWNALLAQLARAMQDLDFR